ncbi:MAG: hypothetical protein Ct9H90mP20_7220 [Candidatus Neomarinimicrobiota bacterium]|nr:MAG: hypothetical protein Ct9H90mP20_7220 [Candidatus Neomarinimicrobiota bacterium]
MVEWENHSGVFETQNIVPDIVTLGKSIGNGHPLSVVVTSEDFSPIIQ